MRKLLAVLSVLLAVFLAGCDLGPPPSNLMLGDSDAALVGDALPDTDNRAEGGTTACDTAANLPGLSPKRLVLHVGGHSWGYYDAARWQQCTLRIIDTFQARGTKVYVATAPTPMAIACGNRDLAQAAFGFPIYGDPDYELRQRIEDANRWKVQVLPGLRPGVKVVRWEGIEHYGWPDCTHFTPAGAERAAAVTQAAF